MQKIIDGLLDKEIKEGNKVLKTHIDSELEKWKVIDGKNFNFTYIQFEEEYLKIEERINEIKKELKSSIAAKLKKELRVFYSALF